MEHIYYAPFSEERKALRKQWSDSISMYNPNRIVTDWETYVDEAESKIDLLEYHEMLPASVQIILIKFSEQGNDYETCSKLQDDLEELGFTIDYGLDAEPYNLRKL